MHFMHNNFVTLTIISFLEVDLEHDCYLFFGRYANLGRIHKVIMFVGFADFLKECYTKYFALTQTFGIFDFLLTRYNLLVGSDCP